MAIPKKFWKEEAKESAHKDIKNALLSAGETPHKLHKSGSKEKHHSKVHHKKTAKGKGKVAKVMEEFKHHTLHSGSKKGPKVTNPKQAIAISLSEARKAGAKIPRKKK